MSRRDPTPRRPGRPKNPIPRETFLAAARRVFSEDGFGGATVERIATEAGVTKAALLHHFGSKDELYRLTVATIADDLGRLVIEALIEPGSFLERLDRLGDRVVRYLVAQPEAARLLVRELVDAGPFLRRTGNQLVFRALDATAALLRSGVEAGAVVTQDPGHLAGSIVSLHLLWFAASPVSKRLCAGDPLSAPRLDERVREVQSQVRRLCGAPPLEAKARKR